MLASTVNTPRVAHSLIDPFYYKYSWLQVFDYDRLCPTDDLLGTAEVFFSEEAIETDPTTGGEKVRIGC
jgi:hypothetical protein